ncbi:hypothetical protein MASR1M32_42910 [Rhodobacter sp.]
MFRTIIPTLFAATLALSACVETPPADPMAPSCGAEGLSGLVGQNRKVLDTMKFANPVRIIEPGMPVTADYIANRLNIEVDAKGTITRVSCG